MPSKILNVAETTASAEKLRIFCQTTPSMNAYQPLATSAVEVCAAAAPNTRKKAWWLAAHAVKRTATLIENGANVPLSSELLHGLETFESALDMIRRLIESIPERDAKSHKFSFSALAFIRESTQLRAELDRNLRTLLKMLKKPTMISSASRTECILEIAILGTRAADAICEIPVLNMLKPAVGMVALICDTAKTVRSNRKAALELASHAQDVTNLIVDRATALYGDPKDGPVQSLAPLCRTLKDVHAFLKILQSRRWRVVPWLLATKDQDRFAELNSALDKALSLFSCSESIGTAEILRDNTQTLVATVHCVEDVQRSMTLVHRDLTALTMIIQTRSATASKPSCRSGGSFFFIKMVEV